MSLTGPPGGEPVRVGVEILAESGFRPVEIQALLAAGAALAP